VAGDAGIRRPDGINEPVNGVRLAVTGFDPNGIFIPAEARGTNYARVLLHDSRDEFNGDYNSLQISVIKRMANRWSGRVAYTLQKGNGVGLGNPDVATVLSAIAGLW
jgi:hypothetical protein